MARRRRRSIGSADLSGAFGLESALAGTAQDVIDLGVMAAGVVLGTVVGRIATSKIPWIKDQRSAITGGVRIAGGVGLGIGLATLLPRAGLDSKLSSTIGAGVGGGMAADGLVGVLLDFFPALAERAFAAALMVDAGPSYRTMNGLGVTGTEVGPNDNFRSLSAAIVEDNPSRLRPLAGFAGAPQSLIGISGGVF